MVNKRRLVSANAVVMTSENGSMEIRLIKHVIEHVNKFVRKYVCPEQKYCLTLDGHSSRNGYVWLEFCRKLRCEVLQLPSDTSHFLQPCDRKVNKFIKRNVKIYREKLRKLRTINLNSIQTKMILSIVGILSVQPSDIKDSFEQCGLWPMDFRFLNLSVEQSFTGNPQISNDESRPSDAETVQQLRSIVCSNKHPTEILEKATNLLEKTSTVHKILSKIDVSTDHYNSREEKEITREVLYRGTPAKCLTIGDLIENRRKLVEEKNAKKVEQANRKAKKKAKGRRNVRYVP